MSPGIRKFLVTSTLAGFSIKQQHWGEMAWLLGNLLRKDRNMHIFRDTEAYDKSSVRKGIGRDSMGMIFPYAIAP